ncbi:uncharacterized protein CTHT_0054700 [Thermochaetoides thermophila DSM 1495]|uniref:Uncharacterized protein n=1 Tax=Chaetomium thermophilum (strain DSM 1495 / CBS 144.50 / IMI 039719) TaxID=759272 RepID=G0SBT3_CHATD|nr:hypothetical protein CTHT_0054700 [Thermochaetoides thermophila DSM 1495]EGS18859.1 hypothetical protein CTHT_0054700 [Thermochaetoides thermophila DSM 1495]
MLLFETTEGVIEVLWDIALAFFAFRLALIYGGLILASYFLFAYLAYAPSSLLPSLHLPRYLSAIVPAGPGAETSTISPLPLLLLATALAARITIAHYEVPRSLTFRLAVGVLAAVLVLLTEGIGKLVAVEFGQDKPTMTILLSLGLGMGTWERMGAGLVSVAGMPVAEMWIEKWTEGGKRKGKRDMQAGLDNRRQDAL